MLATKTLSEAVTLCADGRAVDVARQDIWGMLQAAAKPELRKVFAAAHLRPCWLDTGKHPFLNGILHCPGAGRRGIDQCTGLLYAWGLLPTETQEPPCCQATSFVLGWPGALAYSLVYLSMRGHVNESWACLRKNRAGC